jgi:alpha-ribazole phosphatase
MKAVTQFDFLRHGAVDGPNALYGRTDVCLSERGLQQMRQQEKHFPFPDNVVSSPLRRCKEFATTFARESEKELIIMPELRECDFGEWDGIHFDDTSQHWPLMTSFWQDPISNTPPQGESLHDFHHRVISGWQQLEQNYREQHTVVVCHGGVIRQILAHLLPVDWQDGNWYAQLSIGYASLTRITIPNYQGARPIVNFIGLPADIGIDHLVP